MHAVYPVTMPFDALLGVRKPDQGLVQVKVGYGDSHAVAKDAPPTGVCCCMLVQGGGTQCHLKVLRFLLPLRQVVEAAGLLLGIENFGHSAEATLYRVSAAGGKIRRI